MVCIFNWPGRIKPRVVDELAYVMDVLPTVMDAGGIPAPQDIAGTSLVPLLEGKKVHLCEEIFCELYPRKWRAVRNKEWKYINTPELGDELYHLADDPHELKNLAADAGQCPLSTPQDIRDVNRDMGIRSVTSNAGSALNRKSLSRIMRALAAPTLLLSALSMASLYSLPPPRQAKRHDWPLFRNDTAQTGYTQSPGPETPALSWRFPIEAAIYSAPVVENDKLYVSSPGYAHNLFCVDPRSGGVIWRSTGRKPFSAPPIKLAFKDDITIYRVAGATSTPIIYGNHILVTVSRHGLLWIDKSNGHMVLERSSVMPIKRALYPYSSPAFREGKLYLGGSYPDNPYFICYDAELKKIVWKYDIGVSDSTPAMDTDRLYVGTHSGALFCLSTSGQLIWKYLAGGAVTSSPLVAAGKVYFASHDGTLYCLNQSDGALVWRFKTGGKVFSSPMLLKDKLYIGSDDSYVYNLKASDGKLLWKYKADDAIRTSPVVSDNQIIVGSLGGYLYALDALGDPSRQTTKQVWRRHTGFRMFSTPVVWKDAIVVASTYLRAFSARDGSPLWEQDLLGKLYIDGEEADSGSPLPETRLNRASPMGFSQSTPIVVGGTVFVGGADHFVYAVGEQSGKMIWRFETGDRVSAAPAYYEGNIFVGSCDGYFYCLDAHDGKLVWKQYLGLIWGPANVLDGKVFVPGEDGENYCLSAKSGATLWKQKTGQGSYAAPPISERNVYFGSWDAFLYALNLNGDLLWKFKAGSRIDSGSPAIGSGRIVFGTGGFNDGFYYCLNTQDGKLLWKYQVDTVQALAGDLKISDCTPAIDTQKGRIVVAGVDNLYCLNMEGERIWKIEGIGFLSGPAIAQGKVYIGHADGYVYCLDEMGNGDGTTRIIWKYKTGRSIVEGCSSVANGRVFVCSTDGYLYAIGEGTR